jgi:hypothetical protein
MLYLYIIRMNPYYKENNVSQLVATICIYGHGRTEILEINSNTANIFNNTRLYTLGSKCGSVTGSAYIETRTLNYLRKKFQTDLVNKTTFDVLKEYQEKTSETYKEYFPEENIKDIGQLYNPITFNKIIGNDGGGINGWYQGIYLVSIHEMIKTDNMLKLIYPLPNHEEDLIDLFKLSDIQTLIGYLREYFENRSIQDPVPELINNAKNTFPDINTLLFRESWDDKKKRFFESPTSLYYIEGNNIRLIRMSELVKLLKSILGVDTKINIMDYTCNNFSNTASEQDKEKILRYKHPADIESGQDKSFGGKGKRKTKKNKTRKKQFLYNPNDPKKSFDVYIDKNPKDTIPIKYATVKDVNDTINKLEELYKTKKYSHKRIWQVGMIMKVRLEALKKHKKTRYPNAKNVSSRFNLANKYFKFLSKRTKKRSFNERKNMIMCKKGRKTRKNYRKKK